MVTTVCDTLGAPVPHQQVVVVGVIVHTDNDTPVVRIPAYTPLYQHTNDRGFMQTNGIAHVSTTVSDQFIGIALDAFTAVHTRGDEGNQMSVAISGLVSTPVPMTELSFSLPSDGNSLYAEYMTPIFSNPNQKMDYDGEKVPTVTPLPYYLENKSTGSVRSYGRLVQRFSMIEDGGSLLIDCKPSDSLRIDTKSKKDAEEQIKKALDIIKQKRAWLDPYYEKYTEPAAGENPSDDENLAGVDNGNNTSGAKDKVAEAANQLTQVGVTSAEDEDADAANQLPQVGVTSAEDEDAKDEDAEDEDAKNNNNVADAANELAQLVNTNTNLDGFGEGDDASDMDADAPTMADLSAPKKRQRGNGSTKRQRKKKMP